jgi:hypothetical protein
MQNDLLILLSEIEQGQHKKLLTFGRKVRPNLTEEDLLQPNDYPELEHNPEFRYEEGVLEGVRTVQSAIRNYLQ